MVERWASGPGELAAGFGQKVRRRWIQVIILAGCLLAAVVLALGVGAVSVPLTDILRSLGISVGPGFSAPANQTIILQLRLPRVLIAAVAGAALAIAGTTFQALLRNPMADPYVMGVSSGASLGAVTAIVLGLNFRVLGLGAVPLLAFAGALGAVMVVYHLARVDHTLSVLTLLLSGLAVGTFLSAIVSLLIYLADQQLHQVVFWLMGGFSATGWAHVRLSLPYFLLGAAAIGLHARELNCLLLGEESAGHLGVDVERAKRVLLAGATLLTATAVSVGGLIGFVGLIVPHAVRAFTGPDHRQLIPAAGLAGAALMVLADTLSRTIIPPAELPVGLITAVAGGPFFIYILRNRKGRRPFGVQRW